MTYGDIRMYLVKEFGVKRASMLEDIRVKGYDCRSTCRYAGISY